MEIQLLVYKRLKLVYNTQEELCKEGAVFRINIEVEIGAFIDRKVEELQRRRLRD